MKPYETSNIWAYADKDWCQLLYHQTDQVGSVEYTNDIRTRTRAMCRNLDAYQNAANVSDPEEDDTQYIGEV